MRKYIVALRTNPLYFQIERITIFPQSKFQSLQLEKKLEKNKKSPICLTRLEKNLEVLEYSNPQAGIEFEVNHSLSQLMHLDRQHRCKYRLQAIKTMQIFY
jgi:hypothetical protein